MSTNNVPVTKVAVAEVIAWLSQFPGDCKIRWDGFGGQLQVYSPDAKEEGNAKEVGNSPGRDVDDAMPVPMDELELNELSVADFPTPPQAVRTLAAELLWLRAALNNFVTQNRAPMGGPGHENWWGDFDASVEALEQYADACREGA